MILIQRMDEEVLFFFFHNTETGHFELNILDEAKTKN